MASEDSSETEKKKQEFETKAVNIFFDYSEPLKSVHKLVKFSEREIEQEKAKEHPDREYISFCDSMRRWYMTSEMAVSSVLFSCPREYRA